MAEWLVTFPASLSEAEQDAALHAAGAEAKKGVSRVPLGDEVAVTVTADDRTADALREAKDVIDVFPSSKMTPY
jgi:hypothetical protein